MPWMICKCDRRFYCLPSEMTEARCDECKKAPPEPAADILLVSEAHRIDPEAAP